MADSIFPSQVSKDRNANLVTNPIFVQFSDGTNAEGDVNVLDVIPGTGATNLGKAEDDVHNSGDVGVLSLAVRQDTQVDFGADGDYVPFSIDANGALRVSGTFAVASDAVDDSVFTIATDSVSVSGYLADEVAPDSVDEGDVGVARMTLDRKQLFVLVDATTDAQRLEINSDGQAQVDLAAHALTNTNPLPVSKDNSANSELNPIFVKTVDTVVSSSEFEDFNEGVDVASDSDSTHTFTASNTTIHLTGVDVSGSGAVKFEIRVGPVASLATVHVGFITGKEGDLKQWRPPHAIEITGTTPTVEVIRTNRQGAAVSVYSTIYGQDV